MRSRIAWICLSCSTACAQPLPGIDEGSSSSTTMATTGDTSSSEPEAETTVDLDTTATDGGTSASTTEGLPECEGSDGTYGGTCPEDAPFCVGGTCTPCSNDDPLTTCDPGEGAPGTVCNYGSCVLCNERDATACEGTSPICDMQTNTCTACTAHDQCPGNAGCHIFEGSCLPSDRVFMVNMDAPGCDTAGQPYCSINSALEEVGSGNDATIRVASGIFVNNVVITSDAVVAIIGDEGGEVSIIGSGGSPGVTVNPNAVGYLQGVAVENNGLAPGVQAAGDIRIDDSTILDADAGLVSNAGRVHLEDVRVLNNTLTGVSVGGTEQVTLRNVIIASNRGGSSPRGFVTTAATPFSMVYTTIADNAGTTGGAISCTGEAVRSVRNSILVSTNFMNAIDCGENLTVTNSVIADPDYESEPTNVPVSDDSGLVFDSYYEIGPGSIAATVADWMAGDPPVDINGVTRQMADGSPDAAGANIPN